MLQHNDFLGYVWICRPEVTPAVMGVTKAAWTKVHANRKSVHNYWVMDYTLTDSGKYRAGKNSRQWHPRRAHAAHLYPPHVPYWEDNRQANLPCTSVYIAFTGGRQVGLERLLSPGGCYARFLDTGNRLQNLMLHMAETAGARKEHGFWPAQSIFASIIDLLLSSRPAPDGRQIAPGPRAAAHASAFVEAAHAYFRRHLNEKITLSQLAQHLNVSLSVLSHRYFQEEGRSPIAALIAMRIQQAQNLLARNYGLKTIAAEVGFGDMYHLSKTFKKVTGMTPRAFRREISGENL